MITIVFPVFNEELILKKSTLELWNFCQKNLDNNWQVVIADNASSDKTASLTAELNKIHSNIKYFYTPRQGKGWGVLEAWKNFPSEIYVFMDIDLSTDLAALPRLISEIKNGSDLVLGSRHLKNSQVQRSHLRNFFSIALNLILKLFFNLPVGDTCCGFKAVNKKVLTDIVPDIKNKNWFFDTEMVILALQKNYRLKEIPVHWQEKSLPSRSSKVKIIQTIWEYLKNIIILYRRIK